MKDMVFERGLPQCIEAEKMILGSLILDGSRWREIDGALELADFALEKHRRIFARMVEMQEHGQPIDRITIAGALMKHGELESIDGLGYLVSLDDGLPAIPNLDAYVRMIQDAAVKRRAILGCNALIEECITASDETPAILGRLERLSRDLQGELSTSRTLSNPEEIFGEVGTAGIFAEGGAAGMIAPPWKSMLTLISGFEPGQMIIVAGRPGTGKSVFLSQCAWDCARSGKNAVILSLEMTKASLLQRFVASRASLPLHRVRGGRLDRFERERAQNALHDAVETPTLRIADKLHTIPAIRPALARLAVRKKIDLIVIDYIQLLTTGSSRQTLREEITQISRAVKLMAGEFECPVLVGSQMSREIDKDSREPRLSDLRESGSLEQDADIVIFPHASKQQDPDDLNTRVEFIVAKQRNGRCGRVPMIFERPFVRFSEVA